VSAIPGQPPLLHDVLTGRAREMGERVAVEFDDATLTYGALDQAADAVAAGLADRGVNRGDLVAIVLPNRSEVAISYFALARLGAVAVPVNVHLKGDGLSYIFEQSGARTAIVDAELVARLTDALAGRFELDRTFVVGRGAAERAGFEPFEALADATPATRPAVGGADPWAILYTSGTTGPAKGVVLPHQLLATATEVAAEMHDMTPRVVSYTFLPLFHLNAIAIGMMSAIARGGRAVVRAEFPRHQLLEDLRATNATHASLPPFVLLGLLAASVTSTEGLALEVVSTIALSEQQWHDVEQRLGVRLTAAYGLTETGMLCTRGGERIGSCGRPHRRHEVIVVDPDDRPVSPGEVGEIVSRPRFPNEIMLGYHRMPDATLRAWRNLWFHTGDAGWLDADGFLWFADRTKDMIKRRGENVSSFEVEQQIVRHPDVAEVAVVPYQTSGNADEEVRAFLELTPGAELDPTALVQFCSEHLAYFMVPRYFDIGSPLPRNAVGKVEKYKLRHEPLQPTTFDVRAAGVTIER
jgi:crotonobetaine/carnitine-CoA ligase